MKITIYHNAVFLDDRRIADCATSETASLIARAIRAYNNTQRVAAQVAVALRELADALESASNGDFQ